MTNREITDRYLAHMEMTRTEEECEGLEEEENIAYIPVRVEKEQTKDGFNIKLTGL